MTLFVVEVIGYGIVIIEVIVSCSSFDDVGAFYVVVDVIGLLLYCIVPFVIDVVSKFSRRCQLRYCGVVINLLAHSSTLSSSSSERRCDVLHLSFSSIFLRCDVFHFVFVDFVNHSRHCRRYYHIVVVEVLAHGIVDVDVVIDSSSFLRRLFSSSC